MGSYYTFVYTVFIIDVGGDVGLFGGGNSMEWGNSIWGNSIGAGGMVE